MERFVPLATFAALMLVGLVAGIFLATQLGQLRVQNMLGAQDFTLVKHSFEVAVGGIMPPLVIAAGLSIVPLAVLGITAGPLRLLPVILAFLLWVGVVIATLVFCAPVNALAAGWDPATPPDDWEALRDQWHLGQTIRTPLAVAAFAAISFAAVLPPQSGA
jgi:uncharacterized membrane protein